MTRERIKAGQLMIMSHRTAGKWLTLYLGRYGGKVQVLLAGCISPPVFCRPSAKPGSTGIQYADCPLINLNDTRPLQAIKEDEAYLCGALFRSQRRAVADLFNQYSKKPTRQTYRQALGKLKTPWLGEAAIVSMRGMQPGPILSGEYPLHIVMPRRRKKCPRTWWGVSVTTCTYAKLRKAKSNLWRLASEATGYYNQLRTLWRTSQ